MTDRLGIYPEMTDRQRLAVYRILRHLDKAELIGFLGSDNSVIYDVHRNECHGAFVFSVGGEVTRVRETPVTHG